MKGFILICFALSTLFSSTIYAEQYQRKHRLPNWNGPRQFGKPTSHRRVPEVASRWRRVFRRHRGEFRRGHGQRGFWEICQRSLNDHYRIQGLPFSFGDRSMSLKQIFNPDHMGREIIDCAHPPQRPEGSRLCMGPHGQLKYQTRRIIRNNRGQLILAFSQFDYDPRTGYCAMPRHSFTRWQPRDNGIHFGIEFFSGRIQFHLQ